MASVVLRREKEGEEGESGGGARGRSGRARVRAGGGRVEDFKGERREQVVVAMATLAMCVRWSLSPYRGGRKRQGELGWAAGGVGLGPTRLANLFFNCFYFSFVL